MLSVDIRKRLGSFTLETAFETEELITGLLGASGCGKSVTLQCIAGIMHPDEGHISLDGHVLFDSATGVNLPPQRRQVGYLFQNYALFPNMTVEQNILCGLRREKNRADRQKQLEDSLDLLRLRGLEKHYPRQLSGGQAQRVALARMLVTGPGLLLLDEPFSALDSHLRDQLQPELLELLHKVGRQVLLVTHSRDEVFRMCSKICIMDCGRVLREGDVRDVFADPGSIAAARLTGCRNVAAARKTGVKTLTVPDWGVTFDLNEPVPEGITAVGIRARSFRAETEENRFPVRWQQELEEPFGWSILFRFEGQNHETAPLWWQIPKEKRPEQMPAALGVRSEDLLLLR